MWSWFFGSEACSGVLNIDWRSPSHSYETTWAELVSLFSYQSMDFNYGEPVLFLHAYDGDKERAIDEQISRWFNESDFKSLLNNDVQNLVSHLQPFVATHDDAARFLTALHHAIAKKRQLLEASSSYTMRQGANYQAIIRRCALLQGDICSALSLDESTESVSWSVNGVVNTLQSAATQAVVAASTLVSRAYHFSKMHPFASFLAASSAVMKASGVFAEPVGQELVHPETGVRGFGVGSGVCWENPDMPSWTQPSITCNVTLRTPSTEPFVLGELASLQIPVHELAPCGLDVVKDGQEGMMKCDSEGAITHPVLAYDRLMPGFGFDVVGGDVYYAWYFESHFRGGYSRLASLTMSFCVGNDCQEDTPRVYAVDVWIDNTAPQVIEEKDVFLPTVGSNSFQHFKGFDAEDAGLTYSLLLNGEEPREGVSINPATGRILYDLPSNSNERVGPQTLTTIVVDPFGLSVNRTLVFQAQHYPPTWQFSIDNHPVVLPGHTVKDNLPAAAKDDRDHDDVLWRFASVVPSWLNLDSIRGQLTLSPPFLGVVKGDHVVAVQPCDKYNYCAVPQNMTVTVGDAKAIFHDQVTMPDGVVGVETRYPFFNPSSVSDPDNAVIEKSGYCRRHDGSLVEGDYAAGVYTYTPQQNEEHTIFSCTRVANGVSQSFPWSIVNRSPGVLVSALSQIEGVLASQAWVYNVTQIFVDYDDPDYSHMSVQVISQPSWLNYRIVELPGMHPVVSLFGVPPDNAAVNTYALTLRADDVTTHVEHKIPIVIENQPVLAQSPVVALPEANANDEVRVDLTGRCLDADVNAVVTYEVQGRSPALVSQAGNVATFTVDKTQTDKVHEADVKCRDGLGSEDSFVVELPTVNRLPENNAPETLVLPKVGERFNYTMPFYDPDGNAMTSYWRRLPLVWGLRYDHQNRQMNTPDGMLGHVTLSQSAQFCVADFRGVSCQDVLLLRDNSNPVLDAPPNFLVQNGLRYSAKLPTATDPDGHDVRVELKDFPPEAGLQGSVFTVTVDSSSKGWDTCYPAVVQYRDGFGGVQDVPVNPCLKTNGIAFDKPKLPSSSIVMGRTLQVVERLTPDSIDRNLDNTRVAFSVDIQGQDDEPDYWQGCTVESQSSGAIVAIACFSFFPTFFDIVINATQVGLNEPGFAVVTKHVDVTFDWESDLVRWFLGIVSAVFFAALARKVNTRLSDQKWTKNLLAIQSIRQQIKNHESSSLHEVKVDGINEHANLGRQYEAVTTLCEQYETHSQLISGSSSRKRIAQYQVERQNIADRLLVSLRHIRVQKQDRESHEFKTMLQSCVELLKAKAVSLAEAVNHIGDAAVYQRIDTEARTYVDLCSALAQKDHDRDVYTDYGVRDVLMQVSGVIKGRISNYKEDGADDVLVVIMRELLSFTLFHHGFSASQSEQLRPFGRANLLRVRASCQGRLCSGGVRDLADMNTIAHKDRLQILEVIKAVLEKTKSVNAHTTIHHARVCQALVSIMGDDDTTGLFSFLSKLFDVVERKGLITQLRLGRQKNYAGRLVAVQLVGSLALNDPSFIHSKTHISLYTLAADTQMAVSYEVLNQLAMVLKLSKKTNCIQAALKLVMEFVRKDYNKRSKKRDDGLSLERYHDAAIMVLQASMHLASSASEEIRTNALLLMEHFVGGDSKKEQGRSRCCCACFCSCSKSVNQQLRNRQREQGIKAVVAVAVRLLQSSDYEDRPGNHPKSAMHAIAAILGSDSIQDRFKLQAWLSSIDHYRSYPKTVRTELLKQYSSWVDIAFYPEVRTSLRKLLTDTNITIDPEVKQTLLRKVSRAQVSKANVTRIKHARSFSGSSTSLFNLVGKARERDSQKQENPLAKAKGLQSAGASAKPHRTRQQRARTGGRR